MRRSIDQQNLSAVSTKRKRPSTSRQVERVSLHYGQPGQRDLDTLTVDDAKRYLSEGHFPAGSMGPKIRAAIQYVEAGGPEALITSPSHLEYALAGRTGTRIRGG